MINVNEYDWKEVLNQTRGKKWGISNIEIGDEMDEISGYIADGDIEGKYSAILVFEEEFVNIAKYAYTDEQSRPVMVSVAVTENGTELIFIDFGIPFNPIGHAKDKLDMDKVGGHGIEIIMGYSKEVEYKREMGANMLRILV